MASNWGRVKIKYLAVINPSKGEARMLSPVTEVTFVPMEKVIGIGKIEYDISKTINEVIDGYTFFSDGDIIMAKVTPCFENGNIGIVDKLINGVGFGSTEFHVLRCKNDCYNRFLYYALQVETFKSKAVSEMYGVAGLKRVPTQFISNYKIDIPKVEEQKYISKFLDQKTSEIDDLIADKERLIGLLQEQRQAIITEAVTKGINPDVKMKGSGVGWLGDVPNHWEVKRIKQLFEIVKRLYYKEDRDVLSITQKGLKIKDLQSNDGQHAQTYAGYQLVTVDDFAMNSMDLLTGYIDCSKFEGVTSPDYRVFRFRKNSIQNHNYYKYLFQMCYTNKIFYGFGQGVSTLGRWRLQTEVFLNFLLPQPTKDEQFAIAEFLDCKTKEIEDLIDDTGTQIQNLKKYRQSLISEVVTGKIDVRNYSV